MNTKPVVDISVPLLDLVAQYGPLRAEILRAITRVCDSQRFIMGPEVDGLERELGAMLGAEHAIGVSSGTDALLAVLMAIGIGPRPRCRSLRRLLGHFPLFGKEIP